jgi:plastocyanin
VDLSATGIQFDKSAIEGPAGQPFAIKFKNNDPGTRHSVTIKDPSGAEVFKGEIFSGVDVRIYPIPALAAGTYTFSCAVHPSMTGTLTVK